MVVTSLFSLVRVSDITAGYESVRLQAHYDIKPEALTIRFQNHLNYGQVWKSNHNRGFQECLGSFLSFSWFHLQ